MTYFIMGLTLFIFNIIFFVSGVWMINLGINFGLDFKSVLYVGTGLTFLKMGWFTEGKVS